LVAELAVAATVTVRTTVAEAAGLNAPGTVHTTTEAPEQVAPETAKNVNPAGSVSVREMDPYVVWSPLFVTTTV
jgi:hypothetical protein